MFPAAETIGPGYVLAGDPYSDASTAVTSITASYQDTRRGRLFVIELYFLPSRSAVKPLELRLSGSVPAKRYDVGQDGVIAGPTTVTTGVRTDVMFGQGTVLAHLTAQGATSAAAVPALVERVAQVEDAILVRLGH